MNCDAYRLSLHEMLDGTPLCDDTLLAMQAHEKECPACRQERETLLSLEADLAHLDDTLDVPTDFSDHWRHAVRKIAAPQKKRMTGYRVLPALAAGVLILALGGASMMSYPGTETSPKTVSTLSASGTSRNAQVYSMAYDTAETSYVMPASDAPTQSNVPADAKIIKTAYLSLKTTDFDGVVSTLEARAVDSGGYVTTSNLYSGSDEGRSLTLTLRVPAQMLDEYIQSASALGQVTNRTITAEDVTAHYTDIDARLTAAKARRDRLNELVASASNMTELIELESALSDVQLTIEGYERTLSDMDTRISYATVDIAIRETLPEEAAREGDLGLAARIGRAIHDSLARMGAFFEGVALFVMAALPWLAVLALVALVIRFIAKRRKTPKK